MYMVIIEKGNQRLHDLFCDLQSNLTYRQLPNGQGQGHENIFTLASHTVYLTPFSVSLSRGTSAKLVLICFSAQCKESFVFWNIQK